MTGTAADKQRTTAGHFAPGTSGNPAGVRVRGADLNTILREGAPRVARRMVALALAGDTAAADVVLRHGLHPVSGTSP